MGWRDHITHGSFKRVHRDAHGACSTPSDMSGPPTPVHTSSPLRSQERYLFINHMTQRFHDATNISQNVLLLPGRVRNRTDDV